MVVAEPPLCSSGGNLSGRDAKGRREGRDRSVFFFLPFLVVVARSLEIKSTAAAEFLLAAAAAAAAAVGSAADGRTGLKREERKGSKEKEVICIPTIGAE